MTYSPEIIGTVIRVEREKRNWTQGTLGKKIGVVGKQISNYENGITIPPIEAMFKLCEIFDCELGYLLGEEGYSEGTQLQTAIHDSLKLSIHSTKAIKAITGSESSCLSYGLKSQQYTQVLNKVLSSPLFLSFIKSLGYLDEYKEAKNSIYSAIEAKYGSDNFDIAFDVLYNEDIDFEHDPDAEPLPDAIAEIIKELQSAENRCYNMEFGIKVAKYETQEILETLVRSLYPLS